MTAAEAAKIIGREGLLHVPSMAWRVRVYVADVRTRYGITDYLVGDVNDGPAMLGPKMWVEAAGVKLVGEA